MFWTEIMGFRQVAELRPESGLPLKMRFYSGLDDGDVTHHDLALMELPSDKTPGTTPEPWTLVSEKLGLHHVAITWPDREAWLKQIAFPQSKGVPFHLRINHGMTHSAYVPDPDGYLIEVLYELPREFWQGDIDAAQNYAPTSEAAKISRSQGLAHLMGAVRSHRAFNLGLFLWYRIRHPWTPVAADASDDVAPGG